VVFNPVLRDVPTVEKNPKLEYVLLPPHEAALPCIGFNTRRGPFMDIKVRKAALYALDREKFAKIMGFGYARVHQYPRIAPGQPGWAPEEYPDYSYNPKKAEELLKQSKYDGTPVKIYHNAREPDNTFGELILANWSAVGIKVELKPVERLAFIDVMRNTDKYDSAFWKGNTSMGGFFTQYFTTGAPGNWVKYSNSKVDALLEEAAKTFDRSERAEINKKALKIIYSDAAFTSAYAAGSSVAKYKYVKGLRHSYQNIMPHEIWLDK
jgi:peptide/nickel transport system substrate-binding protein